MLTAAKPTEAGIEELKGVLAISGKNVLSMKGTEVEVVKGQHVGVFWGALLDYWLGKTLVTITQGDDTQMSSNVSQGASVQKSLRWSAVET